MTFWKLYSIFLTLAILSVQAAQLSWIAEEFPSESEETSVVIAIPPKPEGVQDLSNGEGEDVVYTEAGCQKQSKQFLNCVKLGKMI